jgi:hypothetical protein
MKYGLPHECGDDPEILSGDTKATPRGGFVTNFIALPELTLVTFVTHLLKTFAQHAAVEPNPKHPLFWFSGVSRIEATLHVTLW